MKKTTGRLEDVRTATKKIGDTYEARLRWVTTFAREDLPKHPGDLAVAADCLVALAWPVPPYGAVPAALSSETVGALHAELRGIFRDLVTRVEGPTVFPVVAPVQIQRMTAVGKKPALWASSATKTSDNPRAAILLTVRDCVLMGGDRLLACLQCQAAFVGRKRQEYCTDICAQRARNARNAPKRRKGAPKKRGAR